MKSLVFPALTLIMAANAAMAQTALPSLTADAAVRQALARGPAIAVAREDRALARIEARRARPAFRPDVGLYARQRLGGPKVTLPGRRETVVPNAETTVALAITQPLLQLGVGDAPSRRADALDAIADAEFRAALLNAALETRSAVYAALRARDGVNVAEAALRHAEQLAQLVEDRIAIGQAAEVHRLEATRGRTEAEAALGTARRGEALAAANLARLLGLATDAPISLSPGGPLPTPPGDLDALLDRALAARPERQALAHAIEAAEAGVRLARSIRLPRISFEGGYTVNTPLAFVPNAFWSAGLRLDLPIFSSAQDDLDTDSARAQARRARQLLAQLDGAIALEVETARVSLLEAIDRADLAEQSQRAASGVLEITLARVERGYATPTEAGAARLALQRAGDDLARAIYDQRIAAAQLDRALGRDPALPAGETAPVQAGQ